MVANVLSIGAQGSQVDPNTASNYLRTLGINLSSVTQEGGRFDPTKLTQALWTALPTSRGVRLPTTGSEVDLDGLVRFLQTYQAGGGLPPPGTPGFMYDAFWEVVSGVLLAAHVGAVGATWTLPGSENTENALLTNNATGSHSVGLNTAIGSNAAAHYRSSGVPSSADTTYYSTWLWGTPPADGSVGLSARVNADCSNYYSIEYNFAVGGWQLFSCVAGSRSQIGSNVVQALVASTYYDMEFSVIGTAILFKVDKVTKITTTSSAVIAAGNHGLRFVAPTTGSTPGVAISQITGQVGTQIAQRSIGDSVTVGFKAVPQTTKRWAYPLALLRGRNDYTRSLSSTYIMNQCSSDRVPSNNQVYLPFAYTAAEVITWFTGYNDMITGGTNANAAETYQRCLRAACAWICRAPADVFQGNNGIWTASGTWAAAPSSNINGRSNAVGGSTLTGTVSGSAITVCYNATFAAAGSMGVKIDGVLVDTIDVQFGTVSPFNSGGGTCRVVPMALRYSGLSAGNHTVEISNISGSTTFLFACGTGSSSAGPQLYLADPILTLSGNLTQLNLYIGKISAVVAELQADGFNPIHAPTNDFFDPNTDVDSDGIHPNNAGYQAIADAIASVTIA